MATASFDKSFVVEDRISIEKIRETRSHQVNVNKRNYKAENEKGIELLKQRLSNSGTC